MFRPSQIQDLIDFRELHADYFQLINEYSETLLYNEIIHFMNRAFPEWNSHAGIGDWSAEFVLTAIQNLEYTEEGEYSFLQTLKDMYLNLAADYSSTKELYQFKVLDTIAKGFNEEHREFLDGQEHLPQNDFDALYHELYSSYKSKYLQKTTYIFLEND
ncbi:hypothetical protein [Galbibacter mesophilus]|uniref:hypothetical protein n=1 Tax=Galbibacter mesophilus TaxID=379069 RepID=UPI00191FD9AC|nr:hypothetical protein [Galbibacter mesophilus]MCM5664271.1 hypothetical protein [Galbibacter mesophilus]